MYTLEINGTALVVTNADEPEARALLESDDFKSDPENPHGGRAPPLGRLAPLNIRQASESEVEAFEEALNDDDYEDDEDEDEEDDDGRTTSRSTSSSWSRSTRRTRTISPPPDPLGLRRPAGAGSPPSGRRRGRTPRSRVRRG